MGRLGENAFRQLVWLCSTVGLHAGRRHFVLPTRPPSPDTLSWQPEFEQPERLDLYDAAVVEASDLLNDESWSALEHVRQSPLFETPIAHFLVRSFFADGVDEFLAHLTTIEAALGLQSDYDRGGATRRVATRVSALPGARGDGDDYKHLFDLRSACLHGRSVSAIPGQDRVLARRLVRRVVKALVEIAFAHPHLPSRQDYLDNLVSAGAGSRLG
jgi:hypothetical protein